ncbi:hypothetical protein [Nocardia pseudobrasiliensis]|uniref:Uncharacterized protein n=1 Tax=Nocardia pseudobrasiliensis TaxID=45979 RepID=A0A370I4Z2_9NOCA|nr:hypothetical protein [Nocardia pseudobrasiliensis]RDI65779.1 hypothetical protein DFR76_10594 [Nocardia pseudobrasiliensis]
MTDKNSDGNQAYRFYHGMLPDGTEYDNYRLYPPLDYQGHKLWTISIVYREHDPRTQNGNFVYVQVCPITDSGTDFNVHLPGSHVAESAQYDPPQHGDYHQYYVRALEVLGHYKSFPGATAVLMQKTSTGRHQGIGWACKFVPPIQTKRAASPDDIEMTEYAIVEAVQKGPNGFPSVQVSTATKDGEYVRKTVTEPNRNGYLLPGTTVVQDFPWPTDPADRQRIDALLQDAITYGMGYSALIYEFNI